MGELGGGMGDNVSYAPFCAIMGVFIMTQQLWWSSIPDYYVLPNIGDFT